MNDPDRFVTTERHRLMRELQELLRIPSVSADPARAGSCVAAADWLRRHLLKIGCRSATLVGDDGPPIVLAEGPHRRKRPTVLVYGHYDVQAPDPLEAWITPPFEPSVRDGYVYARGATDDKGQAFALLAACEALMADGTPPVNFRFVIEGGEEIGSGALLALVARRPELVEADVVVIADGPFYAPGWPVAEVGVRGLCYAEIAVRTLRDDLHSGLYGGVAPNALGALVHILHALQDAHGRIRIPGAYADVRRPGRRERTMWAYLPFDADAFTRDEVGAAALIGDARRSVHERMWALPTLDIHGISGGFGGTGVKTVIPAQARAKVSLRLVPDQRADAMFERLQACVRSVAPPHATVTVTPLILNDPVAVDTSSPVFAVLNEAFREVVGRGVSFTRSGGSLPILGALGRGGGAVVVAGIGLPDDRLHAPNERIAIEQFFNGIRVYARFFTNLGGN